MPNPIAIDFIYNKIRTTTKEGTIVIDSKEFGSMINFLLNQLEVFDCNDLLTLIKILEIFYHRMENENYIKINKCLDEEFKEVFKRRKEKS